MLACLIGGSQRRLLSLLAAAGRPREPIGDWQELLARMRECLRHPGPAGPIRGVMAAFRLCDLTPAGLTVGGDDFAALRRFFEEEAADCGFANAWPGRLLDTAAALGRPALTASLLGELERQVGLAELATRNPGLLADMAEARLLQLEDASGCLRCLDALAAWADPAVQQLLAGRARSLLHRLPDAAGGRASESASAKVWLPGSIDCGPPSVPLAGAANAAAQFSGSPDQLLAYCASAGQRRRENASTLPDWDLDERLVALAADSLGRGALREALLEPVSQHGLLLSQSAAGLLTRLLLGRTDSAELQAATPVVAATADRGCPSCGRSLAKAYATGDLDTAGLAERLLGLSRPNGQPVWQTNPDESANFRQWLRHKTTRAGRPGAVLDLNNLLLHNACSGPLDYGAFFGGLDCKLPLAGRPLRHLVFVAKFGKLFTDEFFDKFRQYCRRAPVNVSLFLFKRSFCDDLFSLYASMLNSPGCYMVSADQFRDQRRHLTAADRRAFQRWQATWQVGLPPGSSLASGEHFSWPPGYPVRSLVHDDGAAHLLCALDDQPYGDLASWPRFGWVCVPPTTA